MPHDGPPRDFLLITLEGAWVGRQSNCLHLRGGRSKRHKGLLPADSLSLSGQPSRWPLYWFRFGFVSIVSILTYTLSHAHTPYTTDALHTYTLHLFSLFLWLIEKNRIVLALSRCVISLIVTTLSQAVTIVKEKKKTAVRLFCWLNSYSNALQFGSVNLCCLLKHPEGVFQDILLTTPYKQAA